jgi:AraC family transcriptional regulator of adaptative response / DNA-3-methyladenine glycosylase II
MRRVLFAKQLVDETDWSMTEIALSAGFGSQRRFNACMREVYGRAPSELRRQGRRGGDRGAVELSLVYRPPFDWASLLEFLRPRAIPGVESVEGGEYARTFRTVAGSGSVRVRHEAEHNRLRVAVVASGSDGLIEICARLRQLFDLDAEVAEVDACLSRVPLLQPSVRERPGMRVPGAFDAFETTVRAILGQQISVAGATTLAGRIASRWGDAVPPARTVEGTLRRLFPTPACLAEAPLEEVGIIGSRARTLRALARAVAKDARFLQPGPGLEADLARWRQLPGVGPWTAQIVSMRVLREPDALPADDLGLRKAVRAPGAHPCSARQVEAMLESCRPFRAYAAVRLWSDPPLQFG